MDDKCWQHQLAGSGLWARWLMGSCHQFVADHSKEGVMMQLVDRSESWYLSSPLPPTLTWSSLVFCSWFAYSFLLSSICCLLMLEFILCFSTSALERLRSASALLYASMAFSLAPNAFSYFSLVLAKVVRERVNWAWIRAPSWRNWKIMG